MKLHPNNPTLKIGVLQFSHRLPHGTNEVKRSKPSTSKTIFINYPLIKRIITYPKYNVIFEVNKSITYIYKKKNQNEN